MDTQPPDVVVTEIDESDETPLSYTLRTACFDLSPEEQAAIRSYTRPGNSNYNTIRNNIRNPPGTGTVGDIIRNAILTSPSTDMDVLHLYRGFETEDQREQFINLECNHHNVLSFSTSIYQAKRFTWSDDYTQCCLIRLVVPRGTAGLLYVAPISTVPTEEEVIVLPTVTMRQSDDDRNLVYNNVPITTMEICNAE